MQKDKRQLHPKNALRDLNGEGLTSAWKRNETHRKSTRLDTRASAFDRLGLAIGPFQFVGCFRVGKAVPLAAEKILSMVESGLRRPHPARLEDESCLRQIKSLDDAVSRAGGAPPSPSPASMAPHALNHLVRQLQSMRHQRGLVP